MRDYRDSPAFPARPTTPGAAAGMSKREYAVIEIIKGLLANPDSAQDSHGEIVAEAESLADLTFDRLERRL